MKDRSLLFAFLRHKLGRGLSQAEVDEFDGLLDAYDGGAVKPSHTLADPRAFFDATRELTGPLDQVQVDTVNRLLAGAAHWPTSWLAYGLATAWHEARFKPIAEYGRGNGRRYGSPGARSDGSFGPTYGGQIPYGRGLPQLTWVDNYEWADKALDLGGSLLKRFDRALEPDIAARILVLGMETGAFTGKKLADYLPGRLGTPSQFTEARRIINGTDRAQLIAGYAERFQTALEAGGWA